MARASRASASDGTVADDGAGDHSPFATALLEHIGEPGLAVNFVFGKIRDEVLAATSGRQEPFVYGSLGGEPIYLVPPTPVPAPAPAPPPAAAASPSLEAVFWQSISNSKDPDDYEAYLKQFPKGTFAALAQARLARLKSETAMLTPTPPKPTAPEIEDLDATYLAKQTAVVRSGPDPTTKPIANFLADDAVSVTGRVKGKDWFRVQVGDQVGYIHGSLVTPGDAAEIADWKALQAAATFENAQAFLKKHPDGAFKDRAAAMVVQLTPPPPAPEVTAPEVEDMAATYVATATVNIRAAPDTGAKILGKISAEELVLASGKVKGGDWLRIKRGDVVGYVAASLLAPVEESEINDWKALQDNASLESLRAFVAKHPNGHFKPGAEAKIAALSAALTKPAAPVPAAQAPATPTPPAPASMAPSAPESAVAAGESFRDCGHCPEMVVIPAGSFAMGSASGETGRDADEGPQHEVVFARKLAVAASEVSVEEFNAYAASRGSKAGGDCGPPAPVLSMQPGRNPVSCISYDEAQGYVAWLARQTGKPYRLPTEAEWEYAARGGSAAAYPSGADSSGICAEANAAGCGGKDGVAATGSLKANGFGLHDMIGNVWEWVQDCYAESYDGASPRGDAATGSCTYRVVRGGSWHEQAIELRTANRGRSASGRYPGIGFRVVLSM